MSYLEPQETSLIAFSDGFGCMAVIDTSDTHKDVIQLLSDESPWEVIDSIEREPKGYYKVCLEFWWESSFPENGDELITQIKSRKLIDNTKLN